MSPKYFYVLNPAFLLDVISLLLNYAPNEVSTCVPTTLASPRAHMRSAHVYPPHWPHLEHTCTTQPTTSSSQAPPILLKAAAILDPLTKSVPGMMEALYLMSRVKFLSGQVTSDHVTAVYKHFVHVTSCDHQG